MKIYIFERLPGGVYCIVDQGGEVPPYPLPHLVAHSPDGFEFGYHGSGPADLARSIVGDLEGTKDPDPVEYQEIKAYLIANVPRDDPGPHQIEGAIVKGYLRAGREARAARAKT